MRICSASSAAQRAIMVILFALLLSGCATLAHELARRAEEGVILRWHIPLPLFAGEP